MPKKYLFSGIVIVLMSVAALAIARNVAGDRPLQAAHERLLGSWEQGSCDAQGIICSQLTLKFEPTGHVTWDGYPPFHGEATYRVIAAKDDTVTLHFTHTTGDAGQEPHDSVYQFNAAAGTLTEIEYTRGKITVPRSTTWKRVVESK